MQTSGAELLGAGSLTLTLRAGLNRYLTPAVQDASMLAKLRKYVVRGVRSFTDPVHDRYSVSQKLCTGE